MVYDGFYTSDLREACAELTVWQRGGMKTRILGGVRLSCGTGERVPVPGDPNQPIRLITAEMRLVPRSELRRGRQLDGLHRGGGGRVDLHDQKSQLLDRRHPPSQNQPRTPVTHFNSHPHITAGVKGHTKDSQPFSVTVNQD